MSTAKKDQPDSHRSIIRSTSILSAGTLSSRILGFFRDMMLAKLLGTGFRADAFFVAFKIPNLFRDLVGEGAINSAVVPVLSDYKEKNSPRAFWAFVMVILIVAFMVLSAIMVLGILLAPGIVRAIAPGFMHNPAQLELTVKLTRLMFPYLVFIGLTAYSMGILFTYRSFWVPAFSPCLLNIALIISAFMSSQMEEPVYGLAIGVLAGGVLQLAVQVRPLMKAGIRFYKPKSLKHPGVKRIGRLLLPRLLGTGVYQLTVLIDTFCASLSWIVGTGGISAIYYSNRIIQFPMGVFSVAMASAVLPSLSGMASKKDMDSIKKVIVFSLKNIFFIMCPTIAVLVLLSTPIIRVFFERGEFNAHSTAITSWALMFYAVGLFSFGGIKILVTAFHALQDTRTPVKVAALCLGINTVLNFILMFPLKIGGIALASAIAGTVDFMILFYILDKKLGGLNGGLLKYFLQVGAASVLTATIEYWAWGALDLPHEFVKLIIVGVGGFVVYELICLAMNIEQANKIAQWIREVVVRAGKKF